MLALSFAAGGVWAADGQLARVFDGDTIDVLSDGATIRLRLHAIDAPDQEQEFYVAAGEQLRAIAGDRSLRVERVATTHGRLAAVVFADDLDINGELIRTGFAYAHRKYLGMNNADRRYCELEHEARVAGRGIWALPPRDRVAPWQLRQYYRGERDAFTDFADDTVAGCTAAAGKADNRPGTLVADPVPGLTPQTADCQIKANITTSGRRLYYVPGMRAYAGTFIDEQAGERWFCSETEALDAGWQKAGGR